MDPQSLWNEQLGITETQIQLLTGQKDLNHILELDLNNKGIETIENVDKLINVKDLNLSCNRIRKIDNLQKNSKLNHLKLFHNLIQKVENIHTLKHLHSLQLQSNRIREIQTRDFEGLRFLSFLRVDFNLLKSSQFLTTLSTLKILNLAHNKLTALEGFDRLKHLEEFNVSNNQLQDIKKIRFCTALTELNISHNPELDETRLQPLLSCNKLRILIASNCSLGSCRLPNLPQLRELYIDNNKITSGFLSPKRLFPLLQTLDISHNCINELDLSTQAAAITLKNIKELSFHHNPGHIIPGNPLGHFKLFSKLHILNNNPKQFYLEQNVFQLEQQCEKEEIKIGGDPMESSLPGKISKMADTSPNFKGTQKNIYEDFQNKFGSKVDQIKFKVHSALSDAKREKKDCPAPSLKYYAAYDESLKAKKTLTTAESPKKSQAVTTRLENWENILEDSEESEDSKEESGNNDDIMNDDIIFVPSSESQPLERNEEEINEEVMTFENEKLLNPAIQAQLQKIYNETIPLITDPQIKGQTTSILETPLLNLFPNTPVETSPQQEKNDDVLPEILMKEKDIKKQGPEREKKTIQIKKGNVQIPHSPGSKGYNTFKVSMKKKKGIPQPKTTTTLQKPPLWGKHNLAHSKK